MMLSLSGITLIVIIPIVVASKTQLHVISADFSDYNYPSEPGKDGYQSGLLAFFWYSEPRLG